MLLSGPPGFCHFCPHGTPHPDLWCEVLSYLAPVALVRYTLGGLSNTKKLRQVSVSWPKLLGLQCHSSVPAVTCKSLCLPPLSGRPHVFCSQTTPQLMPSRLQSPQKPPPALPRRPTRHRLSRKPPCPSLSLPSCLPQLLPSSVCRGLGTPPPSLQGREPQTFLHLDRHWKVKKHPWAHASNFGGACLRCRFLGSTLDWLDQTFLTRGPGTEFLKNIVGNPYRTHTDTQTHRHTCQSGALRPPL